MSPLTKSNNDFWRIKVAAFLHDPPEKALILMNKKGGHEGGTVAKIKQELGLDKLPSILNDIVKKADHWASAADRPNFPKTDNGNIYQKWQQINFLCSPILKHPLSGQDYDLKELLTISLEDAEKASLEHLKKLIIRREDSEIDWEKTFLSLWRNASIWPSEIQGNDKLGELWSLLPADTRIPDHSIWEHLNLCSAFAGAMFESEPALLEVSLGPVQAWIAQSRSTSDLWAGSHLLSTMSWEAMKVICENVGPDALIIPDIKGIPVVDLWLDKLNVFDFNIKNIEKSFIASLPNRFIALVPSSMAEKLFKEIKENVKSWVIDKAKLSAAKAISEAYNNEEAPDSLPEYMNRQIEVQMANFPEIFISLVPWKFIKKHTNNNTLDISALKAIAAKFYPEEGRKGFLDSDAWKILNKEILIENFSFYKPTPGVLYPAYFDILERVQTGSKIYRQFDQNLEHGYRCSLCGEREWLTDDYQKLNFHPSTRAKNNLWAKLSENRNINIVKEGEYLCAWCTLKRFWPSIFIEQIKELTGKSIPRFVVSTHTMAISRDIEKISKLSAEKLKKIENIFPEGVQQTALPQSIIYQANKNNISSGAFSIIKRIPSAFDIYKDDREKYNDLCKTIKEVLGADKYQPERYFCLLLMDGDKMGAWISGTDKSTRLKFKDTWHPELVKELLKFDNKDLKDYINLDKPPSPARHVAISRALNNFAIYGTTLAVEEKNKGKIIYAGGDDLLAMVSIDDLLGVMEALRCIYSGKAPEQHILNQKIENGHILYRNKKLLRMMGEKATTSMGVIIAHHTAPLSSLLRLLRQAEKEAKSNGRNGFCIYLYKRSGGITKFTSKWELGKEKKPMIPLLINMQNAFANDLSRRASYHLIQLLEHMPVDGETEMFIKLFKYHFKRQMKKLKNKEAQKVKNDKLEKIAEQIVSLAEKAKNYEKQSNMIDFLKSSLILTEFLAREGRNE